MISVQVDLEIKDIFDRKYLVVTIHLSMIFYFLVNGKVRCPFALSLSFVCSFVIVRVFVCTLFTF